MLLKPQTAIFYERATKQTYRKTVIVPKKLYQQFLTLESKLHSRWIYPKDYAYGVVDRLSWWVKKRGLSYLPINTFCGEWALTYYDSSIGNRVYQEQTSEEERHSLLVHQELTLVRLYAEEIKAGNTLRFSDMIEDMRRILDKDWLKLYDTRKRASLQIDVLDILSDETGQYIKSYDEIFRGQVQI